MMKKQISRREMLRDIAKAGYLLPFVSPLLLGGRAYGRLGFANRLIMVYYPNGAVLDRWHPKTYGRLSSGSQLSYAMEPLEPYADKLIALRNLSSKGHGGSSSHPEAASAILSGGQRGQASIDVAIAEALRGQAAFKYLHFGLFNRYNSGKEYLPFRDQYGQSILPEDDPKKASELVFGKVDDGKKQEQLRILESIYDDLAQLRTLSLNQKTTDRLDIHEESINNLESIIGRNLTKTCGFQARLEMGIDRRQNNLVAEDMAKEHIANIVAALECDMTQVVSFQFMAAQDESLFINFPSVAGELDKADGGGFGSNRKWWNQNLSHPSSHEANQVFTVQNRWYNMMVAELCRQLSVTPDPLGGGSLLDTSMICVVSENGESANHGQEDLSWYLLGGAGGFFDVGKVVDCGGLGSSNLLLELARGMGLSWNRFGNGSTGISGLY